MVLETASGDRPPLPVERVARSTGRDLRLDDVLRSVTRRLILGRSDELEHDLTHAVTLIGGFLHADALFVDASTGSSPPQLRAAWCLDGASSGLLADLDAVGAALAAATAARIGGGLGHWLVADPSAAASDEPALRWLAAHGFRTALLVPLFHEDAVIGVLGAASRSDHADVPEGQPRTDRPETRWTREVSTGLELLADVVGAVVVRRAVEHGPAGSNLRYRDILDDQTEMICRFTPSLRVTYANQAYAVQYGHSSESIIGHSLLEFFPQDKHEWAINQVARMGRDLLVNCHENEVVFADGSRGWFQWTDTVTLGADGEVSEIQAVGRNITESRQLADAMRRSEERFRRAFEDAPIGMAVLDDGGHILRANQALTRFLDVGDPADLQGRVLVDIISPLDRRDIRTPDEDLQGEVRFLRPDGTTRWAEISFSRFDVDEHVETLGLMQVVDLDDRKRAEEQLEHEALHDPLTGLPNRSLLLDRLGVALQRRDRGDGQVAVLFGDLDQFKLVNDSFGHEVGDRLLRLVAQRLSRALRSHDTLARFGGDEFVVLAEGLESPTAAQELARRLIASLAEPLNLGVAEVSVGVSVGIAMADDEATPSELVRRADTAMYVAKDGERPRIAFYDGSLERQSAGRLSLQTELSRAMDNDDFVPVYQPVVDADGVAIGAEALVRWHRDDSMEAPTHFLSVAEDMGLIVPLGTRILERACEQVAAWSATSSRSVQAWVNVSGREMTHHGFVAAVERCLETSGLSPDQLCLELTEWTVLSDISAVARTMASLQDIGVRFALDDFGTGYSALDLLRRLPLDAVKIDRVFVGGLLNSRPTDRALVTAIADLGVALGLAVVGEGVESHEQARLLRKLGVPLLQGFHLAHPALPEDLAHWFLPKDVTDAAA